MEKSNKSIEVCFENDFIIIKVDELILKYKISEISERLDNATDEEKSNYTISPSGYGIHWQKIDEDISIHALIGQKIKTA
jgi:hypothetical protein